MFSTADLIANSPR